MKVASSLPVLSATEPRDIPHHQTSEPAYTKTTSEEECLLCGELVDIRLMPCEHVIICRECSQRAKKCPQCKVSMCREELLLYVYSYKYH